MALLLILLIYQSLCCFLIAMPKYAKQLPSFIHTQQSLRLAYKLTGFALFSNSIVLLVSWFGLNLALVWLCALITLSGTTLILLFSYRPSLAVKPISILSYPLSKLHFASVFLLIYPVIISVFIMIR